MVVRKSHLIALAVLLALAAAYFGQRAENRHALDVQRDANIVLCEASVERSSYIANGFRQLSLRVGERNNPGDPISAANYQAVAESIISTFPGVAKNDSRVDRIETFDNRVEFRIPAEARALQAKGCEQAFGKLPAVAKH